MISRNKLFLIGFLCNIFEWYDFSVYAYLASEMGILFFNEDNPKVALIKSFLIFSLSYFLRPFGAFFLGYLADKRGRKIALRLSLLLVAAPMLFIGLLPTYENAGLTAIVLLLLLRSIQGFGAGGELPINICYMYEAAPVERKNFYCSLVSASSMFGVLSGSFIVTLLHTVLKEQEILQWGWRIPFFIGVIISVFIFWIRNLISETVVFEESSFLLFKDYLSSVLKYKTQIMQVFALYGFLSVCFYLFFVWLPSYLRVYLAVAPSLSFLVNSVSFLTLVISTLIVGYFTKNEARTKLIKYSILIMAFFAYPLFITLNSKSMLILLVVPIIFALILSLAQGVIMSSIASLFPPQIRGLAIGLGFTIPVAILGGLTPTLSSWISYISGYHEAPVFFIIIMALLALLGLRNLRRNQNF